MSDINFGELVKENRLALRLSIKELAARVERSEDTVRSWERGESQPTADEVFVSLAAVLKVDEKQLRAAAGQKLPEPEPPTLRAQPAPTRPAPSYRDDPREMLVYWIRGALTAAALIALLIVLIWALSGLADQLGGLFGE